MKNYPFFFESGNDSCKVKPNKADNGMFPSVEKESKTLEWKWFFSISFCFFLLIALSFQGYAQSPVSSEKALKIYGISLQDLVTGLNPTLFISNGEIKTTGQGSPEVVICDGSSASLLYRSNPSFKKVKLLRINIPSPKEIPDPIDLEALQGFENLQFVYFVFGYDVCGDGSASCLGEKVSGLLPGHDGAVITFYEITIAQ